MELILKLDTFLFLVLESCIQIYVQTYKRLFYICFKGGRQKVSWRNRDRKQNDYNLYRRGTQLWSIFIYFLSSEVLIMLIAITYLFILQLKAQKQAAEDVEVRMVILCVIYHFGKHTT